MSLDIRRNCVVCMNNTIETVAIPCRHCILCKECMDHTLNYQNRKCPICRTRINYVINDYYEDELANIPRRVIRNMLNRFEYINNSVYYKTYDYIKSLIFMGIIFLLLGIFFHNIIFIICAIFIGYFPWLVITIYFFENSNNDNDIENHFDSPNKCQRLFTMFEMYDNDTCFSYVCRLLLIIVAIPFSIPLFFIPYVLFIIIYRFFINKLLVCVLEYVILHSIINIVFFVWKFIINPVFNCLVSICNGIYDYVMLPLYNCLTSCCNSLYNCITSICDGLYDYVMLPLYNC